MFKLLIDAYRFRNLKKISTKQFPILAIAIKSSHPLRSHYNLSAHRNQLIRETVHKTLGQFEVRPASEMVEFFIENAISHECRPAEIVHLHYQAKNTNRSIADWEDLAPRIRTQLKIITTITQSLLKI